MSDKQRLFLALNPADEERRMLYQLARGIVARTGGRAMPQQNLHLTLRFFGSTSRSKRDCIEAVADTIRAESIQLEFGQLKRVRDMVWAVAPDSPALQALVQGLQVIDSDCDVAGAIHPFSAHITLIRDAKRIPADLPPVTGPVCCLFDKYSLMESQTLPQGSQYTEIRSWPLI